MKRLFLLASPAIGLAVIATWVALGANTGWTKNRVQETHIDEITGIEHAIWTERWVPGVDFLAVGLACSAVLLIASLAIRARKA